VIVSSVLSGGKIGNVQSGEKFDSRIANCVRGDLSSGQRSPEGELRETGERDEIYVGSEDEKWSTVALAEDISSR
jgi:hypothetical protein